MDFPQTFVKGAQTRVVHDPAGAVKARFEGFTHLPTDAGTVDYRQLQEAAKKRGIPANQSAEALVEALRAPENQEIVVPAPPTDETPADES